MITINNSENKLSLLVAFLKVNPCNQSAWIWLADLIEHKYLNAIKHKVLLNDLLPDLLIDGFVKAGLGNHQIVAIS